MSVLTYNPQLLLPAPTKSEVLAETALQLIFLACGELANYVNDLTDGAIRACPVSKRNTFWEGDDE